MTMRSGAETTLSAGFQFQVAQRALENVEDSPATGYQSMLRLERVRKGVLREDRGCTAWGNPVGQAIRHGRKVCGEYAGNGL